ncbi:helix-turn-helix domain-containing protein [Kitasatospora sp. CB01950]|uniref:helix-turn-helix domain-containing protein n=1 Tax=Kitasatospora sp. CB01950 TaxID=1703930 RepID=UPI003082A699
MAPARGGRVRALRGIRERVWVAIDPADLGRSKSDLARALKELRYQSGLSGDRLARRCGMTQSKISKIETGRSVPSLVDVELILRALDVPVDLAPRVLELARVANTEWQDVRALRQKGLEKNRSSWRRSMRRRPRSGTSCCRC